MDSLNNVYITYYDGSNYDLKYTTNVSGSWKTSTIESDGQSGGHNSIAIDSNNKVHITFYYYDPPTENSYLKYKTNVSGSWAIYTIDDSGSAGAYNSIAIDSNNKVHISYTDTGHGSYNYLMYATNASGSWGKYTVDNAGTAGRFTSIAIDSNDRIHISYLDTINQDLKYTTNASGSWVISTVDSNFVGGGSISNTSIALDSNDSVHISYYESYLNDDLKYATNASGSWVISTVDSTGDVGYTSSIAVDSNDNVHISYVDDSNDDLKYATNKSGSWVTTTVDNTGNVGWNNSISIDSNNKVHISYYDGLNYDLKYATNASGETIQLPKTGQTTCYDELGNIIDCANTGQDGDIQAGVAWPSQRFTDNGDGTITDNLTGLTWLVDASCLGFRNWNEAFDTVSDFNSNPGNYGCFNYTASHNEWRMPNINELQSLVNNGTSNLRNWLSGQGFMNVQEARYWSSTTFISDTNRAWTYYTLLNNNYAVDKTSQYYIWPVRGTTNGPAEVWRTGQTTGYYSGDDGDIEAGASWPSPRFTDNEDGTVTDNLTGLMWLRDANCIANQHPNFDNDLTPGDGWVTWQHALDFISGMNNETYSMCALGYDDWHLPNITELYSLIDFRETNPSLPADKPFSNIQNYYWSSTTTASQPGDALNLITSDGRIQSYTKASNSTSYVWPVRDGNQMELITYYCDIDSDGYISSSISGNCRDVGCAPEGCQLTQGDDCDDNDNSIYIGAPELCDNKPNDCNNPVATDGIDESWYGNLTNCGLGVCYSSGQLTCTNGSQVDTCTAGDPTGDDSDCDNIDDDCDGTADEHYVVITTNCGLGVCSATGQMQCQNGNETDTCTSGTPTENPEATCNDTLDNDCDSYADLADGDCLSSQIIIQPDPTEGMDVWITSVYDYNDDYGVDDFQLKAGGWGDYYYSLIKFDLNGLPINITSAEIYLYNWSNNNGSNVSMYLDRVTGVWDEDTGWYTRPKTSEVLLRAS